MFAARNMLFGFHARGFYFAWVNFISLEVSLVFVAAVVCTGEDFKRRFLGLFSCNFYSLEEPSYSECVSAGVFEASYWQSNPASSFACEYYLEGRNNVSPKSVYLMGRIKGKD